MDKTAYIVTHISCAPDLQEMLAAWLETLGYESFEEKESELAAYIPAANWSETALKQVLMPFQDRIGNISHEELPPENWNAIWEANYEAVEVGMFCQIVPSFRQPKPGFAHTLRIDPKMSFGTGHHETTQLMIRQMALLSFADQQVLDIGCGTGVLGILAMKMGTSSVVAIDIDPWSEENTRENARLNEVSLAIRLGGAEAIPSQVFDIVLANINRNVLMTDMTVYAQHIAPGGHLIISGFYHKEVPMLLATAESLGLSAKDQAEQADWAALTLVKAGT